MAKFLAGGTSVDLAAKIGKVIGALVSLYDPDLSAIPGSQTETIDVADRDRA